MPNEGHNEPQKFFRSGLLRVKCPRESGRFKHFKYFDNYKSYVNEFLPC